MCVHDVVCDVVDDGASGGEGCSKVGAQKHGCVGDGVCVILCDLVWWNDCFCLLAVSWIRFGAHLHLFKNLGSFSFL